MVLARAVASSGVLADDEQSVHRRADQPEPAAL
jgi:hypothetical protein